MMIYSFNCSFMKTLAFVKYFLLACFFLFSYAIYGQSNSGASPNEFIVVLDAGHGGKDPGAMDKGHVEKEIALDVVLKVGDILEKHDHVKVIYTRTTDVFVTLMGRAQVANKNHADLFVSVHCNTFSENGPHGTETYVLGTYRNKDNLEIAMRENRVIYLEEDYKATYNGFDPDSPASYMGMVLMQEAYLDQSILLAAKIQQEYTALHRYNRGVKKAGFLVIRETYMPSVLTEIGFLSNKAEGRFLDTEGGRGKIASAIAHGILSYIEALNINAVDVQSDDKIAASSSENKEAGIVFKVQLAAGSKPIETKPYNFNGLKGVERVKQDKYYKYYFGNTSEYIEIQSLKRKAIEKGYLTAFIVAFKKGKEIEIDKALKHIAE